MVNNDQIIPAEESGDEALEIISFISSAVPYIGGPVSNIISGALTKRKLARIREFLLGLASDLKEFKSTVTEEYVKTDEFEELLETTLHKVAEERNEQKRQIFRSFLEEAIKSPGESYDEQRRFIHILEQLQDAHIALMKVIIQTPDPNPPGITGSIGQTLQRRLPNIPREKIVELLSQLKDLRLAMLADPNMMLTPHGAEDLRSGLTDYGRRFLKYLKQ
ncbi:MAG: hypothetical protein NT002_12810 [candidate division Zixibacteria bacterium]|nr:hypothetical protein [candidate division Zixibacteria bacterium]